MVPTIFYDGCCRLCNAVVRMLAMLDGGSLRYEPLEGEAGKELLRRHPELRGIDSALLVETDKNGNQRVSMESGILSRVRKYIPWPGKLLILPFSIVPRAIGDPLYRIIARNRSKLFGRYTSCPIPPR